MELSRYVREALGTVLLTLVSFGVAACSGDESASAGRHASFDDAREDQAGAHDKEELVAGAGPSLGNTVTATAEIAEILDPSAFSIASEVGSQAVLVVGARDTMPTLDDESVVKVTGTLREFVIAEIEEDLDIYLDDELFLDYEGEQVLVALSVSILEPAKDGGAE